MKERRGASVVLTGASSLLPRNRFCAINTSKTSTRQNTLTNITYQSSNNGLNAEVRAVLSQLNSSRNSVIGLVTLERRE